MSMGYGNYEELLATYAAWIKWLREKKESLEAQKAAGCRQEKMNSVAAPPRRSAMVILPAAGMDAPRKFL
jgi:hypothetical protein